jgi:Mce-associated membrane protein
VNDEEIPGTAADIRALAAQAEAEAAEAEALAAAARARARAIQLRRRAEVVEATEATEATEEDDAEEREPEKGLEDVHIEVEPESVRTKESADAAEEPEADISSDDDAAKKPARLGRLRRRRKRSSIAAAVAIIIILAALSGSVYMIREDRQADRQRQRVAEFAAAARQGVVTLTSLDFNNAKQGMQRILEDSTGTFKDDFLKMADDFAKVVEQSKVVEQGTVQAAAVDLTTMTNDSAVVLVASTSEVTNAAGAKQDPRTFRLIVTITRDGGQLKMSKVEFVP